MSCYKYKRNKINNNVKLVPKLLVVYYLSYALLLVIGMVPPISGSIEYYLEFKTRCRHL